MPLNRFQWLNSMICSITGLPAPSVTGLTVPSSEFIVWSEHQFHGYTAPGHRIFIFITHLRIYHFVTFREVSLFCATGLSALSLKSHFVIFRYEVHQAWRCRRWWHCWAPFTSYRHENNSFLIITFLWSLHHSFRAALTSWKAWYWTNTEGGSIHHVWSVLESKGLRVDSWSQHTRSAIYGLD